METLTDAQAKELEKAKDHIGWALSKISELEELPSHTTLQQINEALYYSRDNLRAFSELMGWRLTGEVLGPPGGEGMAKLEDFMPQGPKEGPPLPRFLNIKWPSSSNPGAIFPGRYSELPEACVCHTPGCGYRLEHPSTHCYDLTCPSCGAKLWREK